MARRAARGLGKLADAPPERQKQGEAGGPEQEYGTRLGNRRRDDEIVYADRRGPVHKIQLRNVRKSQCAGHSDILRGRLGACPRTVRGMRLIAVATPRHHPIPNASGAEGRNRCASAAPGRKFEVGKIRM